MDGRLSDDNIATRKGASAIEVELKFRPSSPTTSLNTQICTTNFLDSLATIIVDSVGRTHKSLLRLHCTQQSTIKVQILNTYVPVKNMRSNDDVALELQRQLSFAESPFRINVSSVDSTYRPPPIKVINCSENSLIFEPNCIGENGSKGVNDSSLSSSSAWLGLEPHSYSTILIFVSAALLVCLLCSVGGLCFRRFRRNKNRVKDKAKWILAVQQEQAMELKTAKARPAAKTGSQSSRQLLPMSIAIPSFPVVSRAATPSPSPRSVPPLKDPDSAIFQDYAETPPASEEENPYENAEVVYVLEECDESTYLAAQETPIGEPNAD